MTARAADTLAQRPAGRPDGRVVLVIAAAGIVVGLVAEYVAVVGYYEYSPVDVLRDIAVGWSFIGAGLIGWWRRPASLVGPLMVAAGSAWFIGNFGSTGLTGLAPLAVSLASIQICFQYWLFVAYPTGRLTGPLERGFVTLAFAANLGYGFLTLISLGPESLCPCPDNPFLLIGDPALQEAIFRLGHFVGMGLTVALLVVLALRWRRSSRAMRRMLAPTWFGAVVAGLAAVGTFVAIQFGVDSLQAGTVIQGAQLIVPYAFLTGLLSARLARAAVSDLVLDLSRAPGTTTIRDALARSMGDPNLRLAYPVEGGAFVDDQGHPADVTPSSDQAATELRHGGRVTAVLIHDAALNEDPALVEAAGAAAQFAIENERLQAELRAQLEEVRGSRARLVTTADTERRKVERDLHDGAQQRLVSLALALRMAREQAGTTGDPALTALLDDAADELGVALRELRELARGIHPAILTEEGLGAAIEALARRSPFPVEIHVSMDRYPSSVEGTAYFVVCEALANAAKHAKASSVTVAAMRVDGRLRVEVADDGRGGADLEGGSGLRGLADRVAALGGTFRLTSPPAGGTRVVAEIPVT
jgi:signal transduction histidine kinase